MNTLADLFDLNVAAPAEDYRQAALLLPDIRDFHTLSVDVSPEIALAWLHRNDANRPIRHKAVAQYAADLKQQAWKCTGETIKFSKTGRLLDGQHRLSAITESGVTAPWLVNTGLDDAVFANLDTGRRRTGSDVLVIQGLSLYEARIVSAAMPMVMNYQFGQLPHSSYRYPNYEMLDCWHSDSLLQSTCIFVAALPHKMIPIAHAKAFFLHWVFSQRDVPAADTFIEQLFEGDHLGKTDPVYRLREKLLIDRVERRQTDDGVQLHACIKAWNARRAGKAISHWRSLFPRSDEAFPEIAS